MPWFVDVGGLSEAKGDYTFLKFFSKRFKETDSVSFRIIETDKVSRPKSSWVETKQERLNAKKKYFKHLTKELKVEK